MKMYIYSVQDVLTGFAQPFLFQDDEVAKRAYNDFLKIDKHPEDKRLFRLGEMDTDNGNIVADYVPECIQGGGEAHGEDEVQNTI